MKMKKFIALVLVLSMALAVCAVSACAEGEKVTVTMIAAQYGPKTGEWWADFEKKFEESHPEIDFVVDVVSWNDIYTVVNTRLSTGDAPDLLNIDTFADYQADDLLLPAEDFVSPETYAKMYPAFLEQSIVDGVVWAVPDLASARAMYYNADILEAAQRLGAQVYMPPLSLCGDNGAMIGAQAYYEYLAGNTADMSLNAYATKSILGEAL